MGGTREAFEQALREEGAADVRWWANGPGERYGWHAHEQRKVLFCTEGSIRFHLMSGDRDLVTGERLDIPPGTEHAATVGSAGVTCVEAFVP